MHLPSFVFKRLLNKEIENIFPCCYRVTETLGECVRNSKLRGNARTSCLCFTQFVVSCAFSLCFYNSVETLKLFSISKYSGLKPYNYHVITNYTTSCHATPNHTSPFYIQCVPEKRLPFEIKQQCRAFEFECFSSLMSARMRTSLLHRDFLCLRCKLIEFVLPK